MGYTQRGDSWRVNVAYKGERHFATVATEELAKEKEVELKAELIRLAREEGNPAQSVVTQPQLQQIAAVTQSWTLKDAITATFDNHWNGTKSEWWYRLKCDALVAYFGEGKRLHAIDTSAMDAFRKACREGRKWSQATINHHLATLSMVFKIAHQRGGVNMKPVLGIKKANRARVRWVKESEEKAMLAVLDQQSKGALKDWFIVLVDTGMRPEESRQMTGTWCDFREGVVTVQGRHDTGWTPKTENGFRSIPMTKRVKEILERRCLANPKGSLFPYAWDTFTNWWDLTRKAMGLSTDPDFVPYTLRHTFGTRLIQRGVNVEVIQRLMGHASITQTMAYAKLGAKQYIDAIAKLEPIQ